MKKIKNKRRLKAGKGGKGKRRFYLLKRDQLGALYKLIERGRNFRGDNLGSDVHKLIDSKTVIMVMVRGLIILLAICI